MKDSKTRDMTTGSPVRHILAFAVPLFGGLIFQQLYNLVDSAIVGRLLGASALGAVGSTSCMHFMIIGFCMGTCSGFAIPLSQYFGAKDPKNMKKCVGNSIGLTAAIAVLFTVVTVLLSRNILKLMQTPADILDMADSYMRVIFAGIPVTILFNLLSAYLNALGNSKVPVVFVSIASVVNIVLDFGFIVFFRMGVGGAALATVISQAVSGIGCLIYIIRKVDALHVKKEDLIPDRRITRKLLSAGLPMGLQYSVTALGTAILQYFINGLGTVSVSAFSAGTKIDSLFGCVFDAFGTTMATYCGQNVGAGKYDRLKKGIVSAALIGFCYSVVVFTICSLFGSRIALIFLKPEETEIIALCARYLMIVTAFFPFLTLVNNLRPSIQGMGFSVVAIIAGIMELLGRGLVGIFLVPRIGYTGACFGSPIAWVFANIFLIPCCILVILKLKKRQDSRSELMLE